MARVDRNHHHGTMRSLLLLGMLWNCQCLLSPACPQLACFVCGLWARLAGWLLLATGFWLLATGCCPAAALTPQLVPQLAPQASYRGGSSYCCYQCLAPSRLLPVPHALQAASGAGCWLLATGCCWGQAAGYCWKQATGCWPTAAEAASCWLLLAAGSSWWLPVLAAGCWLQAASYWQLLVLGYWLLPTGCCWDRLLAAAGYGLLAAGCCYCSC